MSEKVLNNIHIVLDGYKEYINGTIVFDKTIKEIFPHSNKQEGIDYRGKILLPRFVECNLELSNVKDDGFLDKLINLNDDYLYIDIDLLDEKTILFILKNVNKERLIIKGNPKKLKGKCLISDIALFYSINSSRLKGIDNRLIKGYKTNIVIVDEDFNIIEEYKEGELING